MEMLKEFGFWGIIVLIGVMAGTQAIKGQIKKTGLSDWWIIATPGILGTIGTVGLCLGGFFAWEMAVLVWFAVTFASPALYKYIIGPRLKKMGLVQ